MTSQDHVAGQNVPEPIDEPGRYPRWPVVVLAASAFVAIWGGWVELGRMSGFGTVNLLPGIMDFYVDLAITLPLGMEVYAAYAMGAWLTRKNIEPAARQFAKWSALISLFIGGAGQVAYHLLAAAGIEQAPWQVVVVVACVPVAVLGMASQLAHRLHVPAARPKGAHVVAVTQVAPATPPLPEMPAAKEVDHEPVTVTQVDRPAGRRTLATAPENHPADPPEASRASAQRPRLSDHERQRIANLAENDWSERAIAKEVGRSRATVARVLREPVAAH